MGGSSIVRIRSFLIVLACLTLVAGIAHPDIWAQAVDSQAFVGKWEGTWTNLSHPYITGEYNLTVTKAEGSQVHGRYEKLGATGGRVVADFVGTLEGDKLTYSNSFSSTELTINGNQVRGTSMDNFRLAIQMIRTK
jgi:hypothetical protein